MEDIKEENCEDKKLLFVYVLSERIKPILFVENTTVNV